MSGERISSRSGGAPSAETSANAGRVRVDERRGSRRHACRRRCGRETYAQQAGEGEGERQRPASPHRVSTAPAAAPRAAPCRAGPSAAPGVAALRESHRGRTPAALHRTALGSAAPTLSHGREERALARVHLELIDRCVHCARRWRDASACRGRRAGTGARTASLPHPARLTRRLSLRSF